MISIECDECFKSYKVKPEMAGKRAKCKCGASIQIPGRKKKKAGGDSPRRKRRQPQPESDPWDDDPYADEADDFDTDDFGADDGFEDDYDDRPRRSRRSGGSASRGRSKKGRGRSRKGRKKRSGAGFSVLHIVGMVFGGVAVLGLMLGLLVPAIGLLTAGGIMVVCAALSFAGSLRCMIAAFQEDVICGIMWLFVPFYSLYYIVTRFSELSEYILMWFGGVIGIVVCMGYFSLLQAM